MEWIIVVIVALFLGSWLWKGLQSYRIQRQRKLRAAESFKSIRPTLEKAYSQLANDIRSKYPYIPFCLPTQEDILVNSENMLLRQPNIDTTKTIKKLLDPLIVRAKTDFISYKPDFTSDEKIPMESYSNQSSNRSAQSKIDLRNPPDWDERRKTVYDRDKGRCQRCGVLIPLSKCNIHHKVRRASGGGHSTDNLITLCRDCHGLMPEHAVVTGGPFYVLPSRYTLHKRHCYFASSGVKISDSLPALIARGYSPCEKCMPGYSLLSRERALWIELYARSRLKSILNPLVTEPTL